MQQGSKYVETASRPGNSWTANDWELGEYLGVQGEENHLPCSYINAWASAFGHCLERTPGYMDLWCEPVWPLMLCAVLASELRWLQNPSPYIQREPRQVQCLSRGTPAGCSAASCGASTALRGMSRKTSQACKSKSFSSVVVQHTAQNGALVYG